MDSKFKKFPKFRFVRHRKIKLKKEFNILSNCLNLKSCLNKCDNYYFSPSKVSLISSLPEFKFKTSFDYNRLKQNKIRLKPIKSSAKDKRLQRIPNKHSNTEKINKTVDQSKHLFEDIINLSDSTEFYFNSSEGNFFCKSDRRLRPNETQNIDFDRKRVDTSNNIEPEDHIPEKSLDSISKNTAKTSALKTKETPNNTKVTNLSNFEKRLDQMLEQKLKKFEETLEQTLEQISHRIRFSTPVRQSTRSPVFDPNVSSIGLQMKNQTLRSVGVQVIEQKCHKMTQTLQMCDKSVQTDQTLGTNHSNQFGSNGLTTSKSVSSQTSPKFTTDSDPECPFTPTFRQIIKNSHSF